MKQEIAKNPLKLKNEAFPDPMSNLQQMSMTNMDPAMLANRPKNPYFPEGLDLSSVAEMDNPLMNFPPGNMSSMLEAMAYTYGMGMGNLNMPNMGNMGMNMGMGLGSFDNRPEMQQEDSEMSRYK